MLAKQIYELLHLKICSTGIKQYSLTNYLYSDCTLHIYHCTVFPFL